MNTVVLKGMLILYGHLLLPPQCDFNPSIEDGMLIKALTGRKFELKWPHSFFSQNWKSSLSFRDQKRKKYLCFLWLGSSSQWEFITYKQYHDPARVATNTQLILSLFKLFIWEVQNVYGEFLQTYMNNARKNY